ncbi:MAG: tRNA guanosine(34) transglycosylase Tgt [Candidatus Shapirobacteria bacterium]|nr:tRNA guanosine(34) transglycosylase Tgt [Candidatus Shapirobacteria bacterium]
MKCGNGRTKSVKMEQKTPVPGPIFYFSILGKDSKSRARAGCLSTACGKIDTPAFIPDATLASVKHLTAQEVAATGIQIVLGNLYHLWLRPGSEIISQAGGLHKFMNWPGPIVTDSGGFQVYSLIHKGRLGGKIRERGAFFNSHLDGARKVLTPEESIRMQYQMGSDILLTLDESVPATAPRTYFERSVPLTVRWAARSKAQFLKLNTTKDRLLFGIVQGGIFPDLLAKSAKETVAIGFDGYALGGVAVGLEKTKLHEVIGHSVAHLPEDKPRYMLGIGYPKEILRAVSEGVDLFDCVIPTRNARHASLFTRQGRLNLRKKEFAADFRPIEAGCSCLACQNYSRAYLRHLFSVGQPLAFRLATIHNLTFYASLMKDIRQAIKRGNFSSFARRASRF